jgi:hypothetical protein
MRVYRALAALPAFRRRRIFGFLRGGFLWLPAASQKFEIPLLPARHFQPKRQIIFSKLKFLYFQRAIQ